MIRLMFVFILFLSFAYPETGIEMKNPTNGAVDFTYEDNLSNAIKTFKPEITLEKVLIKIGKQNVATRREKNIFSCMTDTYGSSYCPAALAPANKYTTYKDSTVIERTNTVIDYADKIASNQYYCPSDGYLLSRVEKNSCSDCIDKVWHDAICYTNGTMKIDIYTVKKSNNSRYSNLATRIIETNELTSNQSTVFIGNPGSSCDFPLYYSRNCNGSSCNHNFQLSGSTCNGRDYQIAATSPIPYRVEYICPDNNYLDNGSNCKKTYTYKFYEYQCIGVNSFNESWKSTNSGLSSCTKIDTNLKTVNMDLSVDCNSSIAPANNCTSSEYNCGVEDGGIFLKDNIDYSNGTSTKYLSSITKYLSKILVDNSLHCPSGTNETTGIEREKGECKNETYYSYYEYSCPTDSNQFGFTYEVQNMGGNCNPTSIEQLIDINNDGIKDSCNSSTPPTNNCIRKSYDVLNDKNKPVFVDNQWQCSPFSCNSNKKCGYGLCPYGTTPSDTLFQDVAYNPLGASFNGTCIGEICDYVKNNKISYCVSKQCPSGSEYVTKDGDCYKEECPKGTFMSGSKCISSSY